MLSILIPVYNYPVFNLVRDLHLSCLKSDLVFEILVAEDGSIQYVEENSKINQFGNAQYLSLEKNIGRSAVRNFLASKSSYSNLLFIDGDSGIVDLEYVSRYAPWVNSGKIVLGGRIYRNSDYSVEKSLLFKYGSVREVNDAVNIQKRTKIPVFTSPNFLIPKELFIQIKFDEAFNEYGHEDSIFGIQLRRKGYEYQYIDNPVYHLGIEENAVFLSKSENALKSLLKLHISGKFPEITEYSKILQTFDLIIKLRARNLMSLKFRLLKEVLRRNLLSASPSLILFDLYKILFLCDYSKKL